MSEKTPPIKIPDEIVLRDGRKFDVDKLIKNIGPRDIVNLRTGYIKKPAVKRASTIHPTFSDEEKIWMSTVSPDEVIKRYPTLKRPYIYVLQQHGRKILQDNG
jgi:hypothetical protein